MKKKQKIYQKVSLSRASFDAVLFDLDGVITQTAVVHASVWKKMFDGYLKDKMGKDFLPFDENEDYNRYVDGKPRYKGVESFLQSRGIKIPWGKPEDDPGRETVCGLGNAKNKMFREYLKKHKVKVFPNVENLLQTLKKYGYKKAIISSSKNSREVLKSAGIDGFFDVKVDGVDAARLNLKGKPNPDIFLEASARCGVKPGRAVIFEDAQAGVEAGRRGNFGGVIGVDRKGQPEELIKHGAGCLIDHLSRVEIVKEKEQKKRPIPELGSALEKGEKIRSLFVEKKAAVFLDYDGTLTPIVSRPELAIIGSKMKKTVQELTKRCFVAVVSGRDLEDVRNLVGLDHILYSGSHGFDIMGPQGERMGYQKGKEFYSQLQKAEHFLRDKLNNVEGALVEKKKFSIAVHFRLVDKKDYKYVEDCVNKVIGKYPQMRKSYGKKVFEVQPDLDWNKGKALLWILSSMRLDIPCVLPLYIGDDLTDEDAFQSLQGRGLGIVVGEENRPTAADYRLNNPDEVQAFLETITKIMS
ncbi:MAG: trehalose-phosphatase [Candidatus Aminicenantes bacterium]|nr:trehalose-phosphatase [Candidatus Aminicenantes bacterium]